jgi:hypothetical protein
MLWFKFAIHGMKNFTEETCCRMLGDITMNSLSYYNMQITDLRLVEWNNKKFADLRLSD